MREREGKRKKERWKTWGRTHRPRHQRVEQTPETLKRVLRFFTLSLSLFFFSLSLSLTQFNSVLFLSHTHTLVARTSKQAHTLTRTLNRAYVNLKNCCEVLAPQSVHNPPPPPAPTPCTGSLPTLARPRCCRAIRPTETNVIPLTFFCCILSTFGCLTFSLLSARVSSIRLPVDRAAEWPIRVLLLQSLDSF